MTYGLLYYLTYQANWKHVSLTSYAYIANYAVQKLMIIHSRFGKGTVLYLTSRIVL